jgi:Tfp pilus assembly protein PilE
MSGSARGGGWPRIALDVGVVVVGILIAFALNAWWEMRSASDREAAHLEALRSDLEANVRDLERLAGRQATVASASLELLRVARGEATASRDSIDGLMSEVFSSNRFDASMGAYANLVSSGGLAQLRSPELRAALATFASMLDSRYDEQFSTAIYLEFTRAFVGRTG